jgi:hypothetical protein
MTLIIPASDGDVFLSLFHWTGAAMRMAWAENQPSKSTKRNKPVSKTGLIGEDRIEKSV